MMKIVWIICLYAALSAALSEETCPPCHPQAGCVPAVCPCYKDQVQYTARRISLKSDLEGCPDCPAVEINNCQSSFVRFACLEKSICTDEQLATYDKLKE